MFRKKIYNSVEELQIDVDLWMNKSRTHSGMHCYGKIPIQTFIDSKHLEKNIPTKSIEC